MSKLSITLTPILETGKNSQKLYQDILNSVANQPYYLLIAQYYQEKVSKRSQGNRLKKES